MRMKRLVAPVAVGVVVAVVFVVWGFTTRHSATPEVVEGWAMPNANGTAIMFSGGEDTRGTSYVIAGAWWTGSDNVWHEGGDGASCVGTDPGKRARVQLGIVYVDSDGGAPAEPSVAWLRCLASR